MWKERKKKKEMNRSGLKMIRYSFYTAISFFITLSRIQRRPWNYQRRPRGTPFRIKTRLQTMPEGIHSGFWSTFLWLSLSSRWSVLQCSCYVEGNGERGLWYEVMAAIFFSMWEKDVCLKGHSTQNEIGV